MIIYPQNFEDVLADISLIGEATGQVEEAEAVVTDIQERADEIATKTQDATKPQVYIEYSFNGGFQSFGSGSFADELINKAGGQNIFTNSTSAYISTSSEEVIVSNPEVIIIAEGAMSAACGLSPETIIGRPGWSEISAVQNDQIYEIDERLFLPGPAMIEGLEAMAEVLHPEIFE
jgi:iron complex transport system substrate-binding protein